MNLNGDSLYIGRSSAQLHLNRGAYFGPFIFLHTSFTMSSEDSSATPADLYTCIRQACDKLDANQTFPAAEEQISFVLRTGWHNQLGSFDEWSRDQVAPVLREYQQKHSSKQMSTAQQQKQLADMYMDMVEKQFADKAFHCLSQVCNR